VFWAVLFLLGYVLVTIGAGVILYRPIATIMTEPPNHTHADLREDDRLRRAVAADARALRAGSQRCRCR
jgi:hypothetical protein